MAGPWEQYQSKPWEQYQKPDSGIKALAPKERTWGEAATDIAASVGSGIGKTMQVPGQLYGLIAGNVPSEKPTGLEGIGKSIEERAEAAKSESLKAKEAERSRIIQEAESKGIWEQAKAAGASTIKDPALLISFLAEMAPNLLPVGAAARLGRGVVLGGQLAKGVGKEAAEVAAQRAGVGAALGTGAVMQGADIGTDAMTEAYRIQIQNGVPEDKAKAEAVKVGRAAGLSGAAISLIAQRLPGARQMEEAFAGKTGVAGRLVGGVKTGLGEAYSEAAEEGGGAFSKNLALREVNPEQSLTKGVGTAAALGAIGGGALGGATGILQKQEAPPKPQETPKPQLRTHLNEEDTLKSHPVHNPTGSFTATELGELATRINDYRESEGKHPLRSFSIEDLVDANVEPAQLGYLVASKIGYQGQPIDAGQVQQAARDIDLQSQGGKDFLTRATGTDDLNSMTPAQLYAAYTGLSNLSPDVNLEEGTNAHNFKKMDYETALENLNNTLVTNPFMDRASVIAQIKQSGLDDRQANSILKSAFRNGDLALTTTPHFDLTNAEGQVVFSTPNREIADRAAVKENLTVKESDSDAVHLPQTVITAEELTGPADSYDLRAGNVLLNSVKSEEDAYKQAIKYNTIRNEERSKIRDERIKLLEEVQKDKEAIERMEATGMRGTPEYENTLAEVTAKAEKSMRDVSQLEMRQIALDAPVAIIPTQIDTAFKPSVSNAATEIHKQLAPLLKKYGLENVSLKIVDSIRNGEAEGNYAQQVISVALDNEPGTHLGVMRHEIIHALKELGAFTPKEWELLNRQAQKVWIPQYMKSRSTNYKGQQTPLYDAYRNIYKEEKLRAGEITQEEYDNDDPKGLEGFDDYIQEEAIAEAFRNWKPQAGFFGNIGYRLTQLFNSIRNAFKGLGFQTADTVFKNIEAGKVREGTGEARQKRFSLKTKRPESLEIIEGKSKPSLGKKVTVDTVGQYFDNVVSQEFGGPLDYNNKEAYDRAVDIATKEVEYQLKQANSGLDWYEEDVKKAFEDTEKVIPELKSASRRQLFTVVAAIMSPQTNARDNWFIAAKAFKHYIDTGTMPGENPDTGGLWQGGTQSANKKKQLDFLNNMLQQLGEQATVDWITGDHTVREVNEYRRIYGGMGPGVSGKATATASGFYAFGPKVGPFCSNLNGIYDVTVDKWMTRTFNRYFGTMVDGNGKIVDAPTEPQRRVVKKLVNEVAKNANVKNYQVQSLLWFFEQRLFRELGTAAPSYGFSDGGRKVLSELGRTKGNEPSGNAVENAEGRYSLRPSEPTVRPSGRGDEGIKPRRGRGLTGPSFEAPLQGAPSVPSVHGPDPRIVAVAERVAARNGIPFKRQSEYVKVDPARGKRLADAYEDMKHEPQNPTVKEAYQNLIKQTKEQYQALVDAGYKFWFVDLDKPSNLDYISSPWNAMRDLRQNQEMGVFATDDGFGTSDFDPKDNPLFEQTQYEWPVGGLDGPKKRVLANDLFRAVHDAFGHGIEGAGFRADGEENAWQAHSRLFTGSAVAAITSETRGQNSWVNFGPYAEANRTSNGADTHYADQKVGLLPEWAWTEGVASDEPDFKELDSKKDAKMFRDAVDRVKRGRKNSFPLHVHDIDTYKNARLFLSEDKESGFALIGDEIGSFFSGGKGQAYPTLRFAVEQGGRRIDAYRTVMPTVLGKAGFRPVARVKFNPEFATDIWDYNKFKQFQNGKPDLVFFAYDPTFKGDGQEEAAKAPLVEYQEALDLQQQGLKRYSLKPIVLGKKQEDAQTFNGVHYGKQKVANLNGGMYGSGIRGEEARRVAQSRDPRVKKRVYFYVPNDRGNMNRPEAGLGQHVYTQTFGNILGPGDTMRRLNQESDGPNEFESAVVDAGYDGYAVPNMGMMVILNHNVPVKYEGLANELRTQGKLVNNKIKYSLRQTNTPEFKQWFGKSKIVDKNGEPKVMYHGTARDITTFRPKQAGAIFVTDDPQFAGVFSGMSEGYMTKEFTSKLSNKEKEELLLKVLKENAKELKARDTYDSILDNIKHSQNLYTANSLIRAISAFNSRFSIMVGKEVASRLESNENIMPLYVKAENPFDYQNTAHVDRLLKEINKLSLDKKQELYELYKTEGSKDGFYDAVNDGEWNAIEAPSVQKIIKKLGHDSFYVSEAGVKNLAVYEPSQLKSAIGNIGTFDINNPDIRYSVRANLPAATNARINATTGQRKTEGFMDRILSILNPDTRAKLRAGFIFQFEALERGTKARAAKYGNREYMADVSATAAALESMRSKQIVAAAMRDGVPVYRKGFTTTDNFNGTQKGLLDIFSPLAATGDPEVWRCFQFYAGSKRGARLDAEGREHLFTPADLRAANAMSAQFKRDGIDFDAVYKDYQKWNEALVKYMKDTGVLSARDAAYFTRFGDYIPFYRQVDGESTVGPKIFSSIAGVQKPKALKGGTEKLGDFLENVIRNASAAVESGMKNVAANRGIRDALDLGTAHQVPVPNQDTVSIKENGVTKHYELDDRLLFEAFKGLNVPRMPWVQILAKPADILRNFVTKDPGFILANIMRDSVSAWVTSGSDMTPVIDSFKQFGKILAGQSPEAVAMAKAGLGGYEFKGSLKDSADSFEKALRAKTGTRTKTEKALLPVTALWDMLEQGSNASDMATRAEIYKRVLAETGNEAEALFQASEVMNFSRKGNFAVMQAITALVPFMNARIQGMDVLYRSGFGQAANANKERMQKAFIIRSLSILTLSALYWWMVHDDDEYKKLTKEERDGYWIVPGLSFNGKPFRFPIPFEIGVVFKVLPERILELKYGQDTPKDFRESITRNIVDTLKFNPIPQAFIPIAENITNHSFFTGEKIVGRGLEDVAKPLQYTASTSLFARELGEQTGMSPIQIENVIRGYTGTMGMYAVNLLDSFFGSQGDPVKATTRAEQLPVIKRFFASDSGTVAQYYDLKEEVDEVVRTVNFLSLNNPDKLEAYLKDNENTYMLKDFVSSIEKDMKQIREYRNAVNADKDMSGDEKRTILDELHQYEIALTSDIKAIRKEYH